LITKAF